VTAVTVVVPTIREDCITRFLALWRQDLAGAARLIVVEDGPERSFAIPGDVEHYCWRDIRRDLGCGEWIVSRRSDAVRSYGYWLAWRDGADVIWTLDDDCYPEQAHRGKYLRTITGLLSRDAPQDTWHNTLPGSCGLYPRGYPYGIRGARRPVMLHHGLWSHVPDLDGATQQASPGFRLRPRVTASVVPHGLFPMCGMNLAWRAELTPVLYFPLMGQHPNGRPWGFHRFGDIWAGLLAKRICDHLGWAVTTGAPSVRHSRASDPEVNAALEAPGIAAHETFWPRIAAARLDAATPAGCYRELAAVVAGTGGGYWVNLAEAMTAWAGLFDRKG
jgi:Reversibly glycosylated polypeptide